MVLAIMQPYFFPYIGYFALMNLADQWIVFDTPQYTPQSWMNRNRILHPKLGWQYILAPVRNCSQKTPIHAVRLATPEVARRKILGQIDHYRRYAPFYAAVRKLVEQAFDRKLDDSLAQLNIASLDAVCSYLNLHFQPEFWSRARIMLPTVTEPGGWALAISVALGADHYVNAPGGRGLFQPEQFAAQGISLSFLDMPPVHYTCFPYGFEPNLSILDVLMWNSPEIVRSFLSTARMNTVSSSLHTDFEERK